MLTFDDVDGSVYDYAYPYMESNGIKGTAYATTDLIGTGDNMTAAELQTVYAAGWTVGNHTLTHPHLTNLTLAAQEAEISGGRDALAALGITTGDHVAYPYGEYNSNTLAAMAALSMLTGRVSPSMPAFSLPIADNYQINCRDVSGSTLATVENLIYNAMAESRIIVLLIHKLALSNPPASVWLVSDFQALIDYIVANEHTTITMAELYALLA